jgi:hypothetical protein
MGPVTAIIPRRRILVVDDSTTARHRAQLSLLAASDWSLAANPLPSLLASLAAPASFLILANI